MKDADLLRLAREGKADVIAYGYQCGRSGCQPWVRLSLPQDSNLSEAG